MFEAICKIIDFTFKAINAINVIIKFAEMLQKNKHQKNNRPTKE